MGGAYYTCESTDGNSSLNNYWPRDGIQCNPWETWYEWALAARYHVAVLPMDAALASQFNYTAFWTWMESVMGSPYGYHNFLYSVMDAADPLRSLPLPLDTAITTMVLQVVDSLLPNTTQGVSGFSAVTWALNHRLNATCGSVACIINILNTNKLSAPPGAPTDLPQAMAIPENDAWRYDGQVSLVCSAFAAAGIKAGLAGVLPEYTATEQTPLDNTHMAIWDGSYYTPSNCPTGYHLPPGGNGAVCQLMGDYVLPLTNYNTIPVYANMNEQCTNQWPTYYRCNSDDNSTNCAC